MNMIQLPEITNKVFVNQDWEAQKEVDRRVRQEVSLLAAALRNLDPTQKPSRHKGLRGPEQGQCSYCKEFGLWKNECPNHKKGSLFARESQWPERASTNLS